MNTSQLAHGILLEEFHATDISSPKGYNPTYVNIGLGACRGHVEGTPTCRCGWTTQQFTTLLKETTWVLASSLGLWHERACKATCWNSANLSHKKKVEQLMKTLTLVLVTTRCTKPASKVKTQRIGFCSIDDCAYLFICGKRRNIGSVVGSKCSSQGSKTRSTSCDKRLGMLISLWTK